MKRALLFLAAIPAFAAIDGTVINQTTSKPQPDTILMLMQPGQAGMQQLGTTKTDAQGNFHFDKSPEGPKLLQAVYAGVLYTQMIPPGSPTSGVQVAVYNSTKDPKLDHPAQHFIVLQPTGSELDVTETLVFNNQSKTTFNSPDIGSAQIWIPGPARENITAQITPPGGMPLNRPLAATSREHVYKIDYPVNPGETRFDVNYTLPNATPLTFEGKVLDSSVPVRVVAPNGVTLKSDDLKLIGQEPTTQASIYDVKTPAFTVQVEGTGTLAAERASDEDNGAPKIEEIQPRIYDRMYWLLGLVFGILAIGSTLLWRRDALAGRASTPARGVHAPPGRAS